MTEWSGNVAFCLLTHSHFTTNQQVKGVSLGADSERRLQSASQGGVFLETNGLLVMESSSAVAVVEPWKIEAYIAGYTGLSYIRFDGNTIEKGPPNGILNYPFQIISEGTYAMQLRSNKNYTADPTVSNDCYTRILAEDGSMVNGMDFTKTYARGTPNFWNWNTNFELDDGTHPEPFFDLPIGWYTLQIAGRSKNFVIDRIVLYDPNTISSNVALATNQPESPRVEVSGVAAFDPPIPSPVPSPVASSLQTTTNMNTVDASSSSAAVLPSFWINAGDEQEDVSFISGNIWASRFPSPIANLPGEWSTVPDAFETHRSGTSFTYTLSGFQPDSPYIVTLGWAENYAVLCRTARRLFSVTVNGAPFVTNWDVFTEAGACNQAVLVSQEHTASSTGEFVIDFLSIRQNPMVSVIGIEESTLGAQPSPTTANPLVSPPTTTPAVPLSTTMPPVPMVTSTPQASSPASQPTQSPSYTYLEDLLLVDTTTGETLLSLAGRTSVELDLNVLSGDSITLVAVAPDEAVDRIRFSYLGLTQNEGNPVRHNELCASHCPLTHRVM